MGTATLKRKGSGARGQGSAKAATANTANNNGHAAANGKHAADGQDRERLGPSHRVLILRNGAGLLAEQGASHRRENR